MSVIKCLNCGKTLSCVCGKKTAKDGKSCCKACVATYETKLKK